MLIATISVNIAANVVSPAYDLANLAPKFISFKGGALITGVVGVVIMPWKLTETPELYIFTWLGLVGGLLGTVAGILIADYWIVRRTVLDLADLYRPGGRYWYRGGWNWRAVAAFAVGGVLAVGELPLGSRQGALPGRRADPAPQAARRLRLGGRACLLAAAVRGADRPGASRRTVTQRQAGSVVGPLGVPPARPAARPASRRGRRTVPWSRRTCAARARWTAAPARAGSGTSRCAGP
ncbi:hypothetical protein SMICM304S_02736 [Streptomyces microflavus]